MLANKLQSAVAKAIDGKPPADAAPGIKVCVRVRCFIKEELEGDRSGGQAECCIAMPLKNRVIMKKPTEEEGRSFDFDRCYWSHRKEDPHYADQNTLQEELGEEMITNALEGFNNCIFAYGQTGSGKSYSVLGGQGDQRGLLPRIVESLFKRFETFTEGFSCKTMVSFTEIYNEELRDLLMQDRDDRRRLEIRQHPTQGIFIPGLTEAAVDSCEAVMDLVEYGTSMRQVSATAMNATSSRSHCIFSFKTLISCPDGTSKMSQTHLVDLAGSERAGRTKASGDRLKEGASINKSLSSLARVISELAKKGKNPPFRDSKLTYVLKESLCGNSKTVMMAAISPNLVDFDETLSTMNFAQSVKKVQTKATKNEVNEKGMEEQLRSELEALRAKCRELEERGPPPGPEPSGTRSSFASPFGGLRVSVVKRRLEEQEYLCKIHNTDWASLLQEEKTRGRKRSGVDVEHLKVFQANQLERGEEEDDSSDDEDHVKDMFTFCFLQKMEYAHTKLSLVGPIGADLLKSAGTDMQSRAEVLSKQVEDCKELAKQAESLAARHSDAAVPRLRIATFVAVSSDEVAPTAQVVACVESRNEWLFADDLENRVQHLKRMDHMMAAFRGLQGHPQAGDAWESAALEASNDVLCRAAELKALRGKAQRLDQVEEQLRQEASEKEGLKQKLSAEAQAAEAREKALQAEVERLHRGLAAAQADIAAAREEIAAARRVAVEKEAELQCTRSQLEAAEANGDSRLSGLRQELAMARQQLEQRRTAEQAAAGLAPAQAPRGAAAVVAQSFREAISAVEKAKLDLEQGRRGGMAKLQHGSSDAISAPRVPDRLDPDMVTL